MKNISTNSIALTVIIVKAVLTSLGIEFDAGSVEKAVEGAVYVIALLLAIKNQLTRNDIKHFFFRK